MSKQEYINAAWEAHQEAGDKLTILFDEFNRGVGETGIKDSALRSIQLAERMRQIFSESLQYMEGLKAPGELAGLHADLLDFYREGRSLGEGLVEAFDHVYEISGVIETFIEEGLTILELDLGSSSAGQFLAAIDMDTATLKDLSKQVRSYSTGGPMDSLDDYLGDLFDQLAEVMNMYRQDIQSDRQGARDEFAAEISRLLEGFDQKMQGGLPGLGEVLERRDLLRERYYELGDKINEM